MRKLKTTLTHMVEIPASTSFKEGERYVCAVCERTVRSCNTDETKRCSHMLLDGTELQVLRERERGHEDTCLRCGKPILERERHKNPLAELCLSCQQLSPKSKPSKRSKGVSP